MAPKVQLGAPEAAARAAVDKGWFKSGNDDMRLMGFGRGQLGQYMATESLHRALKSNDPNFRALGVYLDGLPVGMFWLEYKGDRKRAVEMHCFVAPEARGKWAFHYAGVELLNELFDNGIYRVEVEPLRINKRLIKLLRHYGFKQEGIRRSAFWMDGNDYDTVMLRMLKREWAKIQKKKEH